MKLRMIAVMGLASAVLLAAIVPLCGSSALAQEGDFADGLAGGPDFWAVSGVPPGDTLNVRSGPSTTFEVRGELANGDVLRNLGCRMDTGTRWCRIKSLGDQPLEGWVAGRYLAESAGPAQVEGTPVEIKSDDPDGPDLYVRPTGEIEVNFSSGCGALYDADGTKLTAGLVCTKEQLERAETAIAAWRKR